MKKIVLLLTTVFALTLMANDGASLYKKCSACHGAKAEKKALNKSHVIQGWDKEKIVSALKGYKDGSYGGAMKGLMKGQVSSYSDEDIQKVAEYISKLK
ncbi:c-type cytochrome [Sulfurospirillum sp. 1307]|jgi:cytochrome c553